MVSFCGSTSTSIMTRNPVLVGSFLACIALQIYLCNGVGLSPRPRDSFPGRRFRAPLHQSSQFLPPPSNSGRHVPTNNPRPHLPVRNPKPRVQTLRPQSPPFQPLRRNIYQRQNVVTSPPVNAFSQPTQPPHTSPQQRLPLFRPPPSQHKPVVVRLPVFRPPPTSKTTPPPVLLPATSTLPPTAPPQIIIVTQPPQFIAPVISTSCSCKKGYSFCPPGNKKVGDCEEEGQEGSWCCGYEL